MSFILTGGLLTACEDLFAGGASLGDQDIRLNLVNRVILKHRPMERKATQKIMKFGCLHPLKMAVMAYIANYSFSIM